MAINIPILNLPVAVSIDGSEYAPIVQGNVTRRVATGLIGRVGVASTLPASMQWTMDGFGATLAAGVAGTLTVPFNATIGSVTMEADQTGSVTIDIWKCTYTEYNPPTTPTSANSITSATPPAIAAAQKYRDITLSNWTVGLSEGDVLTFSLPSQSTSITRVTLSLNLLRVVS